MTVPLPFSPLIPPHYFIPPAPISSIPPFLVCPSQPPPLPPFPLVAQGPASQDVELEQLDGQTLEEPFQRKLGGCVDVVEHDT